MTTTSQRPSTAGSGRSCTRSPRRPMLATQPRPSPTSSSTAATRPPRRAPTSSPGPSSRILPRRRTTSALRASSACRRRRGAGRLPLTRDITDHIEQGSGRAAGCRPSTRRTHPRPRWVKTQLPPSLAEAVRSFVLACAARACRGQGKLALIDADPRDTPHAVQKEVHRQVEDFVRR
jgi:hypothetical protein